jgi:hypothetical protein
MNEDQILIEILADGTIKASTDKVSEENHLTAEQFLSFIARLLGGCVTKQKREQEQARVQNKQIMTR